MSKGNFQKFAPDTSWGSFKIVPIAKIRDPSLGLLDGDVFVVKLEIRVKTPENESFTICTDSTSATCIVCVNSIVASFHSFA